MQEGTVEFPWQEWVWHVSEELLQQRGHIVYTVLLVQNNIYPTVKALTQSPTHQHTPHTHHHPNTPPHTHTHPPPPFSFSPPPPPPPPPIRDNGAIQTGCLSKS